MLVGHLEDDFGEELQDRTTWYLVDGMAPTEVAARTFAAVSPDREHYRKAGGGRTEGNVEVRFMPVWRLGKLLRARELVFPHLPEQLVKGLHAKWGGVPRYVLQYAQNRQLQRDLGRALDLYDLTLLMEAAGSLETADALSHVIMHWDVSPSLEEYTVVFASKYVHREVVAKLRMHARVDLARQLSSCMGVRDMASLAGAIFLRPPSTISCR